MFTEVEYKKPDEFNNQSDDDDFDEQDLPDLNIEFVDVEVQFIKNFI